MSELNEKEFLALFQRHDDPVRWEHPKNFDYDDAVARFSGFVAAFDAATGVIHEVRTGSQIQDASFHSEIGVDRGWLRFSNFGNMVCFIPSLKIEHANIDTVRDLCNKRGYVFIPSELTETRYTGENHGVTGIGDWWIRYFDYV